MREPPVAFEDQPGGLLDDHLTVVREPLRTALPATLVRTRSVAARHLLARAALGDAGSLGELLDAARTGDARWLRRIRHRIEPAALAGLAQAIVLQDVLATDGRDALGLYELIRAALGWRAVPLGQRGLHAQLTFLAHGPAATRSLLRRYPRVGRQVRAELRADLLNPFAGAPGRRPGPWLAAFGALLPAPAPVLADRPAAVPFDRLTAGPVTPVEGPHRVSVVVTTFRPDEGLLTAVRSIVAQSWRNVEVIVVDDASGEQYTPVLRECLTLGERIRLIRLDVNAGTYQARNAGLDACAGEFVAFQDADDWSHPRRLETQVRALLAEPHLVACTSDGLAVTGELLLTRPSARSSRFNPSSLLFRRDAVMRRIGYFDTVRKGADSEYIGRIQAAFGPRSLHHVDAGGPLALIRLTENSLSRGEVRPFWIHPARVAYISAYRAWHERVAAGHAEAYRPRDGGQRPFAAPEHLRARPGTPPSTRHYDVVYVADWRFLDGTHLAAIDELRALAGAGLRVGLVHLESYRAVLRRRVPMAGAVQHLVNDGVVGQVLLGEPVDVTLVVVRQPTVLQFPPEQPCELRAQRVLVVADRAPARDDGTDRRYRPDVCSAAARRMFGVEPWWCPQDSGVRAAVRGLVPADRLTDADLPHIVRPRDGGWGDAAGRPAVGAAAQPVVGTDLCDSGDWPADAVDALLVCRGLDAVDVRVRLPDRPYPPPRLPATWLAYAAGDLDGASFAHQLDVYLHFPSPHAVEASSWPVVQAAAHGCLVLAPERFAATYGAAAVYCPPADVPVVIRRYHADRALLAQQRRTAREVVAAAHHPRSFVELVVGLLRGGGATAPAPRTPAAAVP